MFPTDPLDAVTHPDPYPYYAELAARQPFFRHEKLGLWVAAGAAEVAAVLGHPECRVRPMAQPVPTALAGNAAGELFGRLIRMNDGPAHAPLKAVVMPLMAGIDTAAARERALALAQYLPIANHDEAFEANRWMFTLPVLTVADLLGMPLARDGEGHVSTRVAGFVATFATAMSPLATPAEVDAGIAAAQWLTRWMRDNAGMATDGGLFQALSLAARDADIEPAVLAANAIGLMIQACEATAGLVGNTLVRMGRDDGGGLGAVIVKDSEDRKDSVDRKDSKDRDIAAWVEDVARTDPPVQNTRRFLATDTMLCGVPVKAGDAVLVLLAAASRDASAAHADKPWTFGTGRHGCPGDALARALATATVNGLLRRGVQPARLARAFRYRPSLNARIPQFL